jgi:hypothetical protein
VDAFLTGSTLEPCQVFYRGEPKFKTRPEGGISQCSGFNAEVSLADFCELSSQIEDAISFLQENEDEMKRLVEFAGVESVEVDFAIEQRDVFVQSDNFPANLLLLCGQLGIELTVSRYVQTED